jgi:hypothetical protein
MSKRRGGSLSRVMRARRGASGLDVRIVIPGLPIAAPDPLAVSLGGSETTGLQLAAESVRQGHRVTVVCRCAEPLERRYSMKSPAASVMWPVSWMARSAPPKPFTSISTRVLVP